MWEMLLPNTSAVVNTVSSLLLCKGVGPIDPVCWSCSLSFAFLTEKKLQCSFIGFEIHNWKENYKCPNSEESAHKGFQLTVRSPCRGCWDLPIPELTEQLLSWKLRFWNQINATAESHRIPQVIPFKIKQVQNMKAKSTLVVSRQEQTFLYSLGHHPVFRLYLFRP